MVYKCIAQGGFPCSSLSDYDYATSVILYFFAFMFFGFLLISNVLEETNRDRLSSDGRVFLHLRTFIKEGFCIQRLVILCTDSANVVSPLYQIMFHQQVPRQH